MSMDEITLNGEEKKFRTVYFPSIQIIKYEYKPFDKWEVYYEVAIERLLFLVDSFDMPYTREDTAAVINDPLRLKRFYKVERIN